MRELPLSISADQILTWSKRPGSILPEWTIGVLRDALDGAPRLRGLPVEIFIQGSYANETNIHGDSDVDIVVKLQLPLEEHITALSGPERVTFWEHFRDTDYGWKEFRRDVIETLTKSYFVHRGRKCLDIRDWDSLLRIPADIVPAIEYRKYLAFPSLAGQLYDEGVTFWDSAGGQIINYPKQHIANGRRKNANTGGRFKQIVRVAKNARRHESAGIDRDQAPSYYVECLFYNIPDALYRRPLEDAYRNCLEWLKAEDASNIRSWKLQNGLRRMFNGANRWNVSDATTLIEKLNTQWINGLA